MCIYDIYDHLVGELYQWLRKLLRGPRAHLDERACEERRKAGEARPCEEMRRNTFTKRVANHLRET